MTKKIEKKIVGYELVKEKEAPVAQVPAPTPQATTLDRPDRLIGHTYKIKTPVMNHALYITINDIMVDVGLPTERRQPFEIFINSKNTDHYQWIIALTRVMSAVFRRGGDMAFLVEELKSVFEPSGGFFKRGGKFMPSLVAEIGEVLENHLKDIGQIEAPKLDEHQQKLVDTKREEFVQKTGSSELNAEGYPAGAVTCKKCGATAAVVMDGCLTCLNCGESKCG